MSSDDSIETRIRSWVTIEPRPPRVTIGDVTYEWPAGTTNEEAQAVLDEAARIAAGARTEHAVESADQLEPLLSHLEMQALDRVTCHGVENERLSCARVPGWDHVELHVDDVCVWKRWVHGNETTILVTEEWTPEGFTYLKG
jgi:hypothetical protein